MNDPAGSETAPESALSRQVGERIRGARKKASLSMVELAAEADISQPFLSKVERGEATPSLHTLYKLGNALGLHPSDLMPAPDPANVTVIRASEGSLVSAANDDQSPLGRLLRAGEGSRIEIFDYSVDEARNVGDWFEHDGESALVLLSGLLRVDVRGQGEWELAGHDVMFFRGPVSTRWTARGPEPAALLLFTVK
ncbi:helix-turn-helix domain-containing protein [Herbiconiux moechotypicola]|uniref:XRE family transcriptional regulator n=1 Tax=Herbiconiux moechotypicola TaxID=637393 RepID=A0ABP5Q9L1_9MICO|nr:helix-turn-helix transcriptional regulator [Herbiconiux moechotypicola]MCS5729400.1 helix-turn-helix domain-containing protein [Herbiconiux moechotypicola]